MALFGAAVVIADFNAEGAADAAGRLNALGGSAAGMHVDISQPESVKTLVDQTIAKFGGIDILVNNAGLMIEAISKPASTIDLESWNRILTVNLTGALLCSQMVAPHMRARGRTHRHQLSSGAFPAQSVYGVSKLALMGLTTTLAQEFGRSKITVNARAPGITDSGAGMTMRSKPSRYSQIHEETSALRARGVPDELSGALLYLCSEAGSWTTGQVLHVDGGAVMRP